MQSYCTEQANSTALKRCGLRNIRFTRSWENDEFSAEISSDRRKPDDRQVKLHLARAWSLKFFCTEDVSLPGGKCTPTQLGMLTLSLRIIVPRQKAK
jgi:hypothetical protein